MGVCNCSMFCCTLLYVHFSIAIILMGKRELIALLNLSSWCLVMVERLFLTVPLGCLQFVIVVFPDHTHLLFLLKDPTFMIFLILFFVGSKNESDDRGLCIRVSVYCFVRHTAAKWSILWHWKHHLPYADHCLPFGCSPDRPQYPHGCKRSVESVFLFLFNLFFTLAIVYLPELSFIF